MKIKLNISIILFCFFVCNIYAKRLDAPEIKDLIKDNFNYKVAYITSEYLDYFFGIIIVESIGEPKYFFNVPIYVKKINRLLEYDVQWIFIKSMEFKNDDIISIMNENNKVYEFNVRTYEVKCISEETDLKLNEIYENDIGRIIEKNKKYKYSGIQPKKNKILKIEDLIKVIENVLFSIYTEEKIKKERPYIINKYKNKWFVKGTLPEGYVGGVFEIVINSETSEIESVIHGE